MAVIVTLSMMVAAPVASQSIAVQAVTTQPASVQQSFDAATKLDDAGDTEGALSAYRALEGRLLATAKTPASLAVVRLRIGATLFALRRNDEAESALRTGLAMLPAGTNSYAADQRTAQTLLAQLLEQKLDLGGAAELYAAVETTGADKTVKVKVASGLARVMMFSAPDVALRQADLMLETVDPADKKTIASVLTLRGRILMNMRRLPEAKRDLLRSMSILGGLTERVDYRDLQARSDLAIVSMLLGDSDAARKYLAYTGAGRFDTPLVAADMRPPSCGGAPAIAPDDMAIVDFAIAPDGTVSSAQTIYASNAASATAFAMAVQGWSWAPEALAKIAPLFRATTRVELRCSKAGSTLDARDLLAGQVGKWMASKQLSPFDPGERSYAGWIADARAELQRRRAVSGAASLDQLPVLMAIMANPLASSTEAAGALATAARITAAVQAPPVVRAQIVLGGIRQYRGGQGGYPGFITQQIVEIDRLLSDAVIAADSQAGPVLLLARSDYARILRADDNALATLNRIVAFPGLADNDPVKVGALIRIASIRAGLGNLDEARAAFEKSGLSESQCALVDAKPVQTGGKMTNADFPATAMAWGFEGFAESEYDIDAKGMPIGIRTTIAYPPLVFGPATNEGMARFRYQQSFRPNGTLGCTGNRQRVIYRIPSK